MSYSFTSQLRAGKYGEEKLDRYFRQWYHIETVSRAIERKAHIDRVFLRPDGSRVSVEYKTDFMGYRTGNLIVEIVSVDTNDTPGWVYTCEADILIWLISQTGEVLCIGMDEMRESLSDWGRKYRRVEIPNVGYKTIGIAVPIAELRAIARRIIFIEEDEDNDNG